MVRKTCSMLLLLVGIVVGLGSFGHALAVSQVHAALDKFPVDPNVGTMLYLVWYWVSYCMFLFGVAIVWAWFRAREGDTRPLFVTILIGILYFGSGVSGMIARHGDSFMLFFVVLGALLLICSLVLRQKTLPA